jgi:hypothetical protein
VGSILSGMGVSSARMALLALWGAQVIKDV